MEFTNISPSKEIPPTMLDPMENSSCFFATVAAELGNPKSFSLKIKLQSP